MRPKAQAQRHTKSADLVNLLSCNATTVLHLSSLSLSIPPTPSNTLVKHLVKLVNAVGNREINGRVSKVNNESTLDGRIDFLDYLERLSACRPGDRGALQRRFEAGHCGFVERLEVIGSANQQSGSDAPLMQLLQMRSVWELFDSHERM